MINVILITSCLWIEHMCTHPYVNIKKSATVILSTRSLSPSVGRLLPPEALTLCSQYWLGVEDTKNPQLQFFLQGNYNLVPLYTTNYKTMWKGREHSPAGIERNQDLQGVCWRTILGRTLPRGPFLTAPWRARQARGEGLMPQGRGVSRCQAPETTGR